MMETKKDVVVHTVTLGLINLIFVLDALSLKVDESIQR